MTAAAEGANINNLRTADLDDLEIPLPRIDEQRRIARVLDAAQTLLVKRRQTILIAADLPAAVVATSAGCGSPRVAIGELCDVRGGKRLPKGAPYEDAPTAHRYLRVTDFTSGEIDAQHLPFLSEATQRPIARYTVAENDIVISIAGSIGLVAVIDHDVAGANLTENAAKLVPRAADRYDPEYLVTALRSPATQAQIRRLTGRVTIGKLALFRIEKIDVPLPPVPQQRAFAAVIRQVREQLVRQRAHLVYLEALFVSLQHRAFSGAL